MQPFAFGGSRILCIRTSFLLCLLSISAKAGGVSAVRRPPLLLVEFAAHQSTDVVDERHPHRTDGNVDGGVVGRPHHGLLSLDGLVLKVGCRQLLVDDVHRGGDAVRLDRARLRIDRHLPHPLLGGDLVRDGVRHLLRRLEVADGDRDELERGVARDLLDLVLDGVADRSEVVCHELVLLGRLLGFGLLLGRCLVAGRDVHLVVQEGRVLLDFRADDRANPLLQELFVRVLHDRVGVVTLAVERRVVLHEVSDLVRPDPELGVGGELGAELVLADDRVVALEGFVVGVRRDRDVHDRDAPAETRRGRTRLEADELGLAHEPLAIDVADVAGRRLDVAEVAPHEGREEQPQYDCGDLDAEAVAGGRVVVRLLALARFVSVVLLVVIEFILFSTATGHGSPPSCLPSHNGPGGFKFTEPHAYFNVLTSTREVDCTLALKAIFVNRKGRDFNKQVQRPSRGAFY